MIGLNAKNIDNIDRKYICPVCSFIIRNPVQLSKCGHRQCQLCIDNQSGISVKCLQCSTETSRCDVLPDRGFKNDMQSLPIECSFCQWTGILQNYEEHLNQTHSHPQCEYCAQQLNSIDELSRHQASDCEKVPIYCALKDLGCNQPILRGHMREHYLSQQHQQTIFKIVCQRKKQSLDSQMDADVHHKSTTITNHSVPAIIEELYQTLNILTGGIEALNDDAQRISNEALQSQIRLQAITEDFSQVKLSVEESHHFLQGVKHNQDILSQDVASLKDKINDMQYVSYDGTYIWKIINFREKMRDAQSERQTSIYSPPFYSSPTGYKMRARFYLYGDGNARGTHLSLFFVLMRSVNDPILKFPFNYKVTFCLYDQTPAQRHIIDSFRPDIRSNSFQRPRSEMNIASGIPKFLPLSMVEQDENPYVRDDTMFIKIMVDFGEMPKTLLPYALSINPGIPTYIQQAMIKQEAERRVQIQQQQQTPAP